MLITHSKERNHRLHPYKDVATRRTHMERAYHVVDLEVAVGEGNGVGRRGYGHHEGVGS